MKNIFLFFLLTLSFLSLAQKNDLLIKQKLIRVTYKLAVQQDSNNQNKKNVEMTKFLDDYKSALSDIELELIVEKDKYLYRKVDKIEPEDKAIYYKMVTALSGEPRYKNTIEMVNIHQSDLFGETYNITLPINEYNWTVTSETKVINGYKCYKAISHFSEFNKVKNINVDFDCYAWFSPEIPVPFGPNGFDGLPGLVLECSQNGKTYFYATNIDFDFKKSFEIENFKKGKACTKEEFSNKQFEINNRKD